MKLFIFYVECGINRQRRGTANVSTNASNGTETGISKTVFLVFFLFIFPILPFEHVSVMISVQCFFVY